MPQCLKCKTWYDPVANDSPCPRCEQERGFDDSGIGSQRLESDESVVIARIRNWADAGYLEDLLLQFQIEAVLQVVESIDPVSGICSHQLLLRVPTPYMNQAIQLLEEEINVQERFAPNSERSEAVAFPLHLTRQTNVPGDGTGYDEDDGKQNRFQMSTEVNSDWFSEERPMRWKPLAIVLVAGGLVYLGMLSNKIELWPESDKFHSGSQYQFLWHELSRFPGVWEQQGEQGLRRRLWFDDGQQLIHIEDDRDGDGDFESHLLLDGEQSSNSPPHESVMEN